MNVCVVGGTGNISTAIVRLLLEVGHDVTVFNRGRAKSLPDGVRLIEGDRKHRPAFEAAMQKEKFEAAIDMVCFDAEDARSSVRAFQGVEHFVQCSTVCTYGVDYDWLPVTEDHPMRPITDYGRNKVAADRVFLAAHHGEDFPVTIIKPSTTMGPSWFLLRQVAWEGSWVDRVRKGKPIVICGDGRAMHQWLHVDDAAPAFVHVLGRDHCVGQTYHMMKREFGTWEEYHRTAMKVIGREVEMVGVPLAGLKAAGVPGVGICDEIFSHNTIYSPERLMRDVPEFRPGISLEDLMADILLAMEREQRVPDSDAADWEDRLIATQRGAMGLGS
ncbi:MAG: NAD-dependent epimerase/dehydratase family protein [Opitutaceae bacterium]